MPRIRAHHIIFGMGAAGLTAAGIGIAGGIAAVQMLRSRRYDLHGKNVLISGGSRGLGLVLGREFSRLGSNIAMLGRDNNTLDRAAADLRKFGHRVLAIPADITIKEEAETAVDRVTKEFGSVDVLVNNAGIISVGPLEVMTIDDFRASVNTHFWGPYFITMALLPEMRRRKQGRIVNISSIGGKISVPHLLPYSVGKFALTGFSEGLRSALLKDNIRVTTVCPGLMRTGSPRNATFKGNNEAEYAWFSISDSVPGMSMSVERAARRIVRACIRGEAEVVLSLQAKSAARFHGVFPGLTSDILGVVDKMLPPPGGIGEGSRAGHESFSKISPSWVTALSERAAVRNNEVS
jgi:NAD(P)-dependent dehydrogenase (short-subunit alcohol dehydrogenase family)